MRIEEIKDQVAKNSEWHKDWESIPSLSKLNLIDEVCKRYTAECCKATLEKHSSSLIQYIKFTDESNITLL